MSRAGAHDGFDVELTDLRDLPLPIFAEHVGTIGDMSDPTYSEPVVQAWDKMKQADAFIVVTPDYNHSVPGGVEERHRQRVAVVRIPEQARGDGRLQRRHRLRDTRDRALAHVFVEAEAVPLRNTVVIPFVRTAFDAGASRSTRDRDQPAGHAGRPGLVVLGAGGSPPQGS
jgi:hypothetical protein